MSSPLSEAIPVPPRSILSSSASVLGHVKDALSRRILGVCLHLVVFFVPLLVYPGQRELLELAKQAFFVPMVAVATIVALWMMLQERRVTIPKNWLHLVPLVFLVGYSLIASQSVDLPLSFLGAASQTSWSVLTLVACVLFYGLILQYVQSTGQVYRLLLTLFLSSIALSFVGLISFLGGWLFPDVLSSLHGRTPLGSVYSLAFFLVPVGLSSFVLLHQTCQGRVCPFTQNTPVTRLCVGIARIALVLAVLMSALVGLRSLWSVVMVVLGAVTLLESYRARGSKKGVLPWAWLGGAFVLSLFFLFVRIPLSTAIPPEVSPNAAASWLIARQVLHERPLSGMGPGTWMYAYTQHRPVEVNAYPFWNIRFDRGYSTVLTSLATIGIVGILLLILLYVAPLIKGVWYVTQKQPQEVWWTFLIVGAGWLGLTGVFFVYNATMAHQMEWWLLFALLAALTSSSTVTYKLAQGGKTRFISMVGLGLLAVGAAAGIGWMGYRFTLEATYTHTVRQFQSEALPLDQTVRILERLQAHQPWNDVYTRALAEGYEQRALRLMAQQSTQEQFVQVRNDISQAIALMLDAVKRHPLNVDNVLKLASLYQRIGSFTPGASDHALQQFTQARRLDPSNPVIVYDMGRVLLQQAETDRVSMQVQDEQKKNAAKKSFEEHLGSAVALFQEAIRMKPNYYSAHYQLGVAYERQGRIQDAITEVEQALLENKKNVGLAFELALLYYRVGDKPAARNLLEQVVKAEPQNMNAHWYLSVVYEDLKDYDKAIAEIDFMLQGELKDHAAIQRRRAALQSARNTQIAPTVHPLPEPIVPLQPSLKEADKISL